MDDTIKSEDDIEKYLGLTTLATIPDRKDFITGKGSRNSRKAAKEKEEKKEEKINGNSESSDDRFQKRRRLL